MRGRLLRRRTGGCLRWDWMPRCQLPGLCRRSAVPSAANSLGVPRGGRGGGQRGARCGGGRCGWVCLPPSAPQHPPKRGSPTDLTDTRFGQSCGRCMARTHPLDPHTKGRKGVRLVRLACWKDGHAISVAICLERVTGTGFFMALHAVLYTPSGNFCSRPALCFGCVELPPPPQRLRRR